MSRKITLETSVAPSTPVVETSYDRSRLVSTLARICKVQKPTADDFVKEYTRLIREALFEGHSVDLKGLGELLVVPMLKKPTVEEIRRLSGQDARLNIVFWPLGKFSAAFAAASKKVVGDRISVAIAYETELLKTVRSRDEARALADALHALWGIMLGRGVVVSLHGVGRLAIASRQNPRVIPYLNRERGLRRMVVFRQAIAEADTAQDAIGTAYAPLALNGPLDRSSMSIVPTVPG